jgi:hypothetical protein
MISKSAEPKSLENWLETATEGITTAGKERIAREIEAHYADAVTALREKGESEESTQAKALAELGKPRLAGRRFRREYLTEADLAYVKRLRENKPRARVMHTLGICVSTAASLLLLWCTETPSRSEKIIFAAYWFVNVCLLPLVLYQLPNSSRVNQMPARLVLIEWFRFTWLGLLLFLTLPNPWLRMGASVPFFWQAIRNLQLRRKFSLVVKET